MIDTAVAAFIGAYSALVVMAEITIANKLVKYLVAALAGLILTVLVALVLGWITGHIPHVG